MANKTYNAFIKHISQICGEMHYQKPLPQKDIDYLYVIYVNRPLGIFKDVVRGVVKHNKVER